MNRISSLFAPKSTDPLSVILSELADHGAPRLSKLRCGWLAAVTIEDDKSGTRIEITSDSRHAEPHQALEECRIRAKKFLSDSDK